MKTKNLVLGVAAVLVAGALWTNNALAGSYYVRLDGGNSTQCTGTVNAAYPGSGTAQPCAFNHPRYALGWGCTNTGTSCVNGGVMKGGDTLYIDGDNPANTAQQAQYEIGYDDTGNNLTPGCSSSWPYDCTLGNLPAGSSSSARTSIIGTGSHKPQLWGTQRVWQVLNADNNHTWLQNLEVTDHSSCAYNSPDKLCNYSGGYPYGQWAVDGLYVGGDDVNVTDVYVHGLGRYGVNTDNFGSGTFTRLNVIGNGYGGFTTGINATIAGTLTFNQPIVEWNGCVESYPLNTTSPTDGPSNFADCFGQNQGGYGDGLAFGNVGHGGAGNWTIYGPGSISFNSQDGLDTLHGTGTGVIQIDKMRFEGNAGDQVKMNALTSSLTNSLVVGDCGWWLGAPQASAGFKSGDICRALGDVIVFNVTNGNQVNLYNNTILSNGNITLESDDINGTGCNASTAINVNNNIILGGYAWIDDTAFNSSGGNSQTTYTYNDGNNGNGAGTCGSLKWNEDYNIVYGTKGGNQGCGGAHDKCSTNPGFASTIPMGASGGGESTFYQGNAGVSLIALNSASPAIASGVGGLTFWNNGNDYHNVTRSNPPSMGGLESKSCAANAFGCFYNSDCCLNSCTNFVCGTASSNPQPVVAITNPVNGSSVSAGSSITITATASESNGTITNISLYNGSTLLGSSSASPYNYVMSNAAAGTYTLTAQATDANGVSVSSNPVTVTVKAQSVLPSSPVVAITSPVGGNSFTAGSNITITATASETNGTISNIAIYNGAGVLLASSSSSPFNFVYSNVLAGTYTFTAQATDASGVSVFSSPVKVTVTAAVVPPPAVVPPATVVPPVPVVSLPASNTLAVSITSPVNNASYTVPSRITFTSSVTDSASSLRVDYYAGAIYLGEATSSPYTVAWNSAQPGTYSLTAKVTDSNGVVFYSAPVSFTVNAHTAPTVSLTSPVNNASLNAPVNITLTANASVTGGLITKVDFYYGTLYLGTAYNSPYSFNWNNVPTGSFSLTAKATDSYGWSTSSAVVYVSVKKP